MMCSKSIPIGGVSASFLYLAPILSTQFLKGTDHICTQDKMQKVLPAGVGDRQTPSDLLPQDPGPKVLTCQMPSEALTLDFQNQPLCLFH